MGCYPLFIVAREVQRLLIIYTTILVVPLSMCSNIFSLLTCKFILMGKRIIRATATAIEVLLIYHDIQNTNGFQRWNTHPSFSHENLNLFIVCVLL